MALYFFNLHWFTNTFEQVQCNPVLPINGAIKCTLHSKHYKEVGLGTLEYRRRLLRLSVLNKIISNEIPAYLSKLIPKKSHQYITGNVNDIAFCQCRTDALKLSFLLGPSVDGINLISKFENIHIQFSETICSTKLDHNIIL